MSKIEVRYCSTHDGVNCTCQRYELVSVKTGKKIGERVMPAKEASEYNTLQLESLWRLCNR